MNGIKYFEHGITPSEQSNFKNFNDSGEQSALVATFSICGPGFTQEKFTKDLIKKLAALSIDEAAIDSNPKLKALFDDVVKLYADLIRRLNVSKQAVVWKLFDGHYHFMDDAYDSRRKEVSALLQAATHRNGHVIVNGAMRTIAWDWTTFEDMLVDQLPRIYLFNERFSLREVLPERIDSNWRHSQNKFLTNFVHFLGNKETDRYLVSNDPEEREQLLSTLRQRVNSLTSKVNQSKVASANSDLLEITLHDKNGIQITVRTDGKKSYYAHLSDNTKFLFAYYLYQEIHHIKGDVLLFDEPNNGFHPTAQTFILNFLKQLATAGNLVIVATHSEHLIDLNFLSDVRLMSSDVAKNIIVKNYFYNQAKETGDYLALQPILDAIGYRYGNQLNIKDKVVVTEGVSDLLYLRAFKQILGFTGEINIVPGRGDATILNIIPFLVSQDINFKIIIDTGTVKQNIQSSFGIEDKFIYEVPIPADYIGKMSGSGIEDLFSKSDFKRRLNAIGHTLTADFEHVSNSHYMRSAANKRLTAQRFYETASSFSESDFEASTIENFRNVLTFCEDSDWYAL